MSSKRQHLADIRNMSFSLLSEGKTIRIKAHGYSMYPTIKPGTIIIIEPLKQKGDPRAGEIVAIRRKSGIVVHRIVKVFAEGGVRKYLARGDSNAYADAPVTIEMIAGRVTSAENIGDALASLKRRPRYFINRLRVIYILLIKKLRT